MRTRAASGRRRQDGRGIAGTAEQEFDVRDGLGDECERLEERGEVLRRVHEGAREQDRRCGLACSAGPNWSMRTPPGMRTPGRCHSRSRTSSANCDMHPYTSTWRIDVRRTRPSGRPPPPAIRDAHLVVHGAVTAAPSRADAGVAVVRASASARRRTGLRASAGSSRHPNQRSCRCASLKHALVPDQGEAVASWSSSARTRAEQRHVVAARRPARARSRR